MKGLIIYNLYLTLDTNCGVGWQENPKTGQCYKIGVENLAWSDAVSDCEIYNGHLIVIQDDAEEEFIKGESRHSVIRP